MASVPARPRSNTARSALGALLRDEQGLSTVEYVLILVLIGIGAIAAWRGFGGGVRTRVQRGVGEVDSLVGSGEVGGAEHASSTGSGVARAGEGSEGANGAGANGGGANGAGANAAGANGGGDGGGAGVAVAARHSTEAGASDGESAIAVLDEREAQAARERRIGAFAVAGLCFAILIGIAVYNTYRAKKIREEAQRQKDLAARSAGSAAVGDLVGPTAGASASTNDAPSRDSLADITIPPP
jgi:Flp pilus assembly pilin Flp